MTLVLRLLMNTIEFVRPTSTFESFKPQNEQQEDVKSGLQKLALAVRKKILNGGRLDNAKLINLYGGPGRGKTHLLEAFLNMVKPEKNSKDLINSTSNHVYLLEGTRLATWQYRDLDEVRVLAIDDLFQRQQRVDQISQSDIKSVMAGIYRAYEKRQLVITTSNFPTNGVLDLIQAQDEIGRVRSRILEMAIGAIELTGDDYREKLSKKVESDPFAL